MLLAWFRNWKCNSQKSHIEFNRWTKSTLSVQRLYSKCPPLARTHAQCLPRHWSIVLSKIVCSRPHRHRWAAVSIVIHTMDLSVADTMLHDSQDLVIQRTETWAVWRPQVGRKKVWHFLTHKFTSCTCAARFASVYCPAETQSRYHETLYSAYRWQQYDVIMTS